MKTLARKAGEAAATAAVGLVLLGFLAAAWICALSAVTWDRWPHK